MIMTTPNGGSIELRAQRVRRNMRIEYTLTEKTNRDVVSADRGILADRYEATITFRERQADARTIVEAFTASRRAGLPVTLSGCLENHFGDHIDHSVDLVGGVVNITPPRNVRKNVMTFDVTIVLDSPVLIGAPVLPSGLTCLSHEYTTGGEWDTILNEAQFGDLYQTDGEADRYSFKGRYMITNDDNRDLFRFWTQQRGNKFTVSESQLGGDYLFGVDAGSGDHEVVILGITYERASPIWRQVELELLKVG